MVNRAYAALLVALLTACDGASAPADARDVEAGLPRAAALPETPLSPSLGPCPEGFVSRPTATDPRLRYCDPWPDGAPIDCSGVEGHFPGEASCRVVGDPCPTGGDGFPPDLPTDGTPIVFVRGGATGGDGSRSAPFGTLTEGVAAAASGGIVAVASGDFDESLNLRDVTIWGACAERVVVHDRTPALFGSLYATRGHFVLRNLHVIGGVRGVLVQDATAELDGLVIEAATETGLRIIGSAASVVDDVVVRDTGTGVNVETASVVTASRLVVERPSIAALLIEEASQVVLSRSVARDTRLDPRSPLAFGLALDGAGTHLELVDSYLRATSLAALAAGTELVVRGSTLVSPDDGDYSVTVNEGSLVMERSYLGPHARVGIHALDNTASLAPIVLRDVIVERGVTAAADGPGAGIAVVGHAVTIERVAVLDSRQWGVTLQNGEMDVTDLTVTGVVWEPLWAARGGGFAAIAGGLVLGLGHRATLARVSIVDVPLHGISIDDTFALDASDLFVADVSTPDTTELEPDARRGSGVADFAAGTLRRVEVRRAGQVGLLVGAIAGPIALEDVTVTLASTEPRHAPAIWVPTIVIEDGTTPPYAEVTLRRVHIEGAPEVAIGVSAPGASVVIEDTSITGTTEAACAGSADCARPMGAGIAAIRATMSLRRVWVEGSALSGLFVQEGATFTVVDTTLARNRVGIAYHGGELDTTLLDAVWLLDNEADVALSEPWSPSPVYGTGPSL